MIPCKVCGKEIAKGAKSCPNCGKDQRNWFMRHKIISFFGFMFLFFFIIGLAGDDDQASTTKDSTASGTQGEKESVEETIAQVGDVVTEGQVEFTVTKVEQFDVIGDPSFLGTKASEGGTLIGIQYKIKNISDKPIGAFSQPVIKLLDSNGSEYSSDIDASSSYAVEVEDNDGKILSDLNPGITTTSSTAFEISEEAYADGEWFVKIGKQKVKIK